MSAEVKYKVLRAQHKAKQMEEEKKFRLEFKQTMENKRQKEWAAQENRRYVSPDSPEYLHFNVKELPNFPF